MFFLVIIWCALVLLVAFYILNKKRVSDLNSELNNSDVKKYMNQLDEMSDHIKTQMFMAMLSGDTAKKVGNIPSYREVSSESDFHLSFEALMDVEIMFDQMQNKLGVNQCAWYMVKYYGNLIFKYGNKAEKAVFQNNVILLKLSGAIYD